MALKKQIIIQGNPFGEPKKAEYWVLTEMEVRKKENKTDVMLVCYENETVAKTSKTEDGRNEPLEYHRVRFSFDGLDFSRKDIYILIKTKENFTDAEDC